MQKQHNRGQDGAGVASIKIDLSPGERYISRYRSVAEQPLQDVFKQLEDKIAAGIKKADNKQKKPKWVKKNVPFVGEVYIGHLRYGTHGENDREHCHPFLRQNNWRSRNLVMAGNFNLTNVDELFDLLVELGQHPKDKVDTVLVMEKIGHFLDEENQRIFNKYKDTHSNQEITHLIEEEVDLRRVLERACRDFDGGYAMAGLTGYGASFVARDPNGIRPAYYYGDEEVIVVASEKPAIKTAFNVEYDDIREIQPGHALIIDKKGDYQEEKIIEPAPKTSCSFERIYFSRGSDPVIYNERKKLGELLCPKILKAIDYDLENTVFSYIPNTAETAFLGMVKGMEKYLIKYRKRALKKTDLSDEEIEKILSFRPRVEKLAIKDVKLRTFITDDEHRDDLVSHVYDTTYEVIKKHQDTIVLIDDSIVRGTTLEKSILKILDRLQPKKIIIVSSAPQIRFPDCYGIDMSRMGEFIAFRAVKELLEESGRGNILDSVYEKCVEAIESGKGGEENYVKALYEPFSYEEVSQKISEIVTTPDLNAEVQVIYQDIDSLHEACPNHPGDWYFTGNYPTQGGNRVVNKSFINFMTNKLERAY